MKRKDKTSDELHISLQDNYEVTGIEQVGKIYLDKIGYAADFYIAEIGNGVGKVL